MKKHRTVEPSLRDMRLALLKISELGKGLKEEVKDHQNIAKAAIFIASEVLRPKCKECGK